MNHLRLIRRKANLYVPCFPFDEINSRSDVSPLITPANLADTAILLVEVQKVVCLRALIGKLSETQAVLGVNPLVDAVFRQHTLHSHVSIVFRARRARLLPNVPQKVDYSHVFVPIIVIHEQKVVIAIAV